MKNTLKNTFGAYLLLLLLGLLLLFLFSLFRFSIASTLLGLIWSYIVLECWSAKIQYDKLGYKAGALYETYTVTCSRADPSSNEACCDTQRNYMISVAACKPFFNEAYYDLYWSCNIRIIKMSIGIYLILFHILHTVINACDLYSVTNIFAHGMLFLFLLIVAIPISDTIMRCGRGKVIKNLIDRRGDNFTSAYSYEEQKLLATEFSPTP